jgi:hypothetical protein
MLGILYFLVCWNLKHESCAESTIERTGTIKNFARWVNLMKHENAKTFKALKDCNTVLKDP